MFDSRGVFDANVGKQSTVFEYPPKEYYRFNSISLESSVGNLAGAFDIEKKALEDNLASVRDEIVRDSTVSGLTNGPVVPFFVPRFDGTDIGVMLRDGLLTRLKDSYARVFPEAHIKVVAQDKLDIIDSLQPRAGTRYSELLSTLKESSICGLYFPHAFAGHSVSSQVKSSADAGKDIRCTLSGPLETVSALIAAPDLITSSEFYSPVLCMSGVSHTDSKLIPVLKSYGQHMEMWIVSNCLVPGIEMVSEQWTGGMTAYKPYYG